MDRGNPNGPEPTGVPWLALVLGVAGLVLLLLGVVLIAGVDIAP
jgi:hypothetical protein